MVRGEDGEGHVQGLPPPHRGKKTKRQKMKNRRRWLSSDEEGALGRRAVPTVLAAAGEKRGREEEGVGDG